MAEYARDSAVAEIKGFQGDPSAVAYATHIREIARVYKWLEGVMAAYTAHPDAKPDTTNVLGDIRTGLAAALRVLRRNSILGDRLLLVRLADRTGWKSPFDLIALMEERPAGGILETIREWTGLGSPAIVWVLVAGVLTMTAGVLGYMNVKLMQAISAQAATAAAKAAVEVRQANQIVYQEVREQFGEEAAREIMASGAYQSDLWGAARQFMGLAKAGLYMGGAYIALKFAAPFLKRYLG